MPKKGSRYLQRKTKEKIRQINEMIEEFGRMTVRQLYYQFMPQGFSYRQVQYAIKRGREFGLIDLNRIVDRSRPSYGTFVFDSLDEYLDLMHDRFKLDYWKDSPKKIEIWTEKDALSQILYEEAEKYRVPVRVGRGWISITKLLEWHGENKTVLYFGDHDPSGMYIDEQISNRDIEIVRVALTGDQIRDHNLPRIRVKDEDPRTPRYKEEYGAYGWELDSLPPDELKKLVVDSIEEYIDFDIEEMRREETEIMEELNDLLEYV